MKEYLDRITKRERNKIIKPEELERLLSNSILVEKRKVLHKDKLAYDVDYIKYSTITEEALFEKLIKRKYSLKNILDIFEKFKENMYDVEYLEFKDYVETCKSLAKSFIEERIELFGK